MGYYKSSNSNFDTQAFLSFWIIPSGCGTPFLFPCTALWSSASPPTLVQHSASPPPLSQCDPACSLSGAFNPQGKRHRCRVIYFCVEEAVACVTGLLLARR